MNQVDSNLTFIGAGNMAKAIIGGLIHKEFPAQNITACSPVEVELNQLSKQFGISTNTDNNKPIANTDVIILCVKPQIMQAVCEQIKSAVQTRLPLVISIAAGITTEQLALWLGNELPIVRCMPNTPAQVHLGASGLFANNHVSVNQKKYTKQLFESIGVTQWVDDEKDLHTITALSGSGPAYCFLFLDAMEKAAESLGLNSDSARSLAIQTMRGAAELAMQSEFSPSELKQQVMSPGGTTEKAIARFEQEGMHALVANAVRDAWQRSYELAKDELP